MKLLSHNGFLLVRPIEKDEKTVSGIIVLRDTSASDEQISSGIVVVESPNFKKGTFVLFNKLIENDIDFDVEDDGKLIRCFALLESDIMFSELK